VIYIGALKLRIHIYKLLFSFAVYLILSCCIRHISVIVADGLWDVMSNKEVSDMAVQVMKDFDMSHGISWEEGGAYQEAAQILTQEAYVRGSSDNIGVCVVAIL
jgi:serine/threonine protein phosphatase PrpC